MSQQAPKRPETDAEFWERMRIMATGSSSSRNHAEEGMAGRAFVKRERAIKAGQTDNQPKP